MRKITLRRLLWSVGTSASLAVLASPLAAPGLTLESSVAKASPQKVLCPLCPDTSFGSGLTYDGDVQRCIYGKLGCDLEFQ